MTNPDMGRYTRAKVFDPGEAPPMLARFSTVAAEQPVAPPKWP